MQQTNTSVPGLDAAALIELCCDSYASYTRESARVTLDSHLESCLQQQARGGHAQAISLEDACFVSQVVYGCVRFHGFISSFLTSFYHFNSGTALRADAVRYRVLLYLAAFRLQELTFPTFKLLLEVQEPQVVLVLLEFLFDPARLQNVCREGWLKDYDEQFVDGTIAGLLAWKPQSDQLLQQLRDQVYFTQRQKDSSGAGTSGSGSGSGSGSNPLRQQRQRSTPTQPQEFKLSQPRPKPLPQPEQLLPRPKPRPPPKHTPGPTREQLAIEAAKAANRAALQARLADVRPFKLRVLERPSQTEALRAAAAAQLEAELAMRPRARPAPPPPAAEVRLNAAAVLREDALYRKKQAEEAAALQRYEAELRDTAAFDRWQAEMREADARQQAERVERLRQELSTAAGAACQAKAELKAEKAAASGAEKAARAARDELRQQLEQQEQQQKAAKAEEVAAGRAKARQALESALAEKRLSAAEVRQQLQQEAQQQAEAAAREAAERRDIITQLKGLEKAAKARNSSSGGRRAKAFDATAVAEFGMNNQMSLEELRARLAAAKQRQQDEEERVRSQILAARQQREAALAAKVTQLSAIRRLASAQANLRKAATQVKRAQTAEAVMQHTESRALLLADRLQAKQVAAAAEAARLAAEERRCRFTQMQNAAGSAEVEAARCRDLRDGLGLACERRQLGSLAAANLAEQNAARLAANRQQLISQRLQQHTTLQARYDRQLAAASAAAAAQEDRLLADRKQAAAAQRAQEQEQQRARHQQPAVAAAGGGGGYMTMQARLQALATGAELPA